MKARLLAIEQKTSELRDRLSGKSADIEDFQKRFEMAWIHHDSALEGVVYTPQELTLAFEKSAVADASLFPTVWQIRNHKAAVEFIRDTAKTSKRQGAITMTLVRELNDTLSGASHDAQAARSQIDRRERTDKEVARERENLSFRKDIPLHKTYLHDIAPPAKVAGLLEKLLDWTGSSEFRELHPVVQAARVQHQFIQIFPFPNTSGKLGRMLSNHILLRNGFFPVVIASVDRSRYFEAFRGSFASFLALVLDSMDNSLDNGLKYFREKLRAFR